MSTSGFKQIVLAPSATPLLRDATHIQFGRDATRAGIIRTPHAWRTVHVLAACRRPMAYDVLVQRLADETPVGIHAARSLIDELLHYRILIHSTRPTVYLIGRSPAARAIGKHLGDAGVAVRHPAQGELDQRYLAVTDPSYPVVAVDPWTHASDIAPVLRSRSGPVLTVTMADSRALVGPWRAPGSGPCVLCTQLTIAEWDERWHAVVRYEPSGPLRCDATVVAAASVEVATMLRRGGLGSVPPGVTVVPPRPGEAVVVDPFVDPVRHHVTVLVHATCPLCAQDRMPSGIH